MDALGPLCIIVNDDMFAPPRPVQLIDCGYFILDVAERSCREWPQNENDCALLISPVVHRERLCRIGIRADKRSNVGGFTGAEEVPRVSRVAVFLEAMVRRA